MPDHIIIFTDGGSRGNPGPAAAAFVALDEEGQAVHQEGHYLGITTNNQAEYQAVTFSLNWLSKKNYSVVNFYLDSQLVVNQINGIYQIKDAALKVHLTKIHQDLNSLKNTRITFSYVPRAQNFRADKLVNDTLDSQQSK